jgi:hypothetical protein
MKFQPQVANHMPRFARRKPRLAAGARAAGIVASRAGLTTFGAAPAFAQAGKAIELRYATVAPAKPVWVNQIERAAKAAEEESGGNVKIAVFPSGQLGSEADALQQVARGRIDIGATGIVGAQKMAAFALVVATYPGIGIATASAAHLVPQVAFGVVPATWSATVDRVADVLSGLLLAAAWYGANFVAGSYATGMRASMLQWPVWPFQLAIGSVMAARAAEGGIRQVLCAGRGDVGWHAGHRHPAVGADDPVRAGHRDLGGRSVQGRRRAGHLAHAGDLAAVDCDGVGSVMRRARDQGARQAMGLITGHARTRSATR